ncbi:MAG: hypothetical protein EOO02_14490 [Chitinophagaceae bacterium]|nr:MAG: hypothetical protein EOO02_14490 [Chitinophagaceae bacterium]
MRSILLSLCLLVVFQTQGQSTQDSVKAAVNLLFEGMKNSDPATITRSFGDSAILQTIAITAEGKTEVRMETVANFAKSVGSRPKGSLDERIKFETIKIDADLASVWTPYEFWFNGKFSHCGVNSFQLVRIKGVWVIQYIIDTRRKKCS